MEISTLTVYHCLVFVWYFFVVYAIAHVRTEERPSEVFLYGGQWKYLTVLNLVLQAVFYGVSFLADVLRLIKKLRCAKCVISSRDLLFSVLAFPVSTFVSISFWILYTYNRELVYPKSLDGVIPLWLNHAMDTSKTFNKLFIKQEADSSAPECFCCSWRWKHSSSTQLYCQLLSWKSLPHHIVTQQRRRD
ncbi:androgen-dependent TFPI-regulating protein isoform X3 [Patagioenas fasciata]|uniref:androgen-dependent TFPI-regulating protein isoform X3 n=1 Tax=Patagioenas fasciata TaxID=372321 RepID=UPI003A99D28F